MNARQGLALVAVVACLALPAYAQKKSDDVVKGTAKIDKPDADGKQLVTITLEVDKEFYIYANPIGNEDLASNQTTVTITGKAKPKFTVEYPEGKLVKDATIGDYKTYNGKVTIKAKVERAKGDTGALEVAVKVQACDKTKCLQPGTVKIKVE